MSEYTTQEAATVEAAAVAGSLRRAGFVLGAVMMFGGLGAIGVAVSSQNWLWLGVGLVEFISAWWVNAFSAAIAHLVKPRF